MAVFVVPPAADPALPGLQVLDTTGDDQIRRGEGSSTVSIPGFTFDIRKIGERATLLFPFLTPGLSLEHFAIAPRREVSDGYRNPFAPASPATPQAGPRRPALVMTSAAMQSLVDQSWSRRDRWSPFQRIMALADRYSADTGKLPALLHEYQAQNGLQPYVDSSMRDPRLWTELGLAADHVRFIGFISRYVTEHRSTRAATELLFLLDKLVQAARTRSSRCWTPSRRRSCAGRATRIRRRTTSSSICAATITRSSSARGSRRATPSESTSTTCD